MHFCQRLSICKNSAGIKSFMMLLKFNSFVLKSSFVEEVVSAVSSVQKLSIWSLFIYLISHSNVSMSH